MLTWMYASTVKVVIGVSRLWEKYHLHAYVIDMIMCADCKWTIKMNLYIHNMGKWAEF